MQIGQCCIALTLGTLLTLAPRAIAQTPPDYGFEFRTVGAAGNAAFRGPVPVGGEYVLGRGQVNYDYRASRTEISTSQWVEFLNAFAPFSNAQIDNGGPVYWGAGATGVLPNGHFTYSVLAESGSGQRPVGGISWRDAARYCNWLQAGKRVDPSALITGAYDTTTFGRRPDGTITDAPTRLPGALYFIPTLDEQMKAEHFDPNRYGLGQSGWWQYKNSSDSPPIPGPPGVGTTSAGYSLPGDPLVAWRVPLGAYTTAQSPWGMWDTSGGATEWNEEFINDTRGYYGTHAAGGSIGILDSVWGLSTDDPDTGGGTHGFRIYSAVPAPGICSAIMCSGFLMARKRRDR